MGRSRGDAGCALIFLSSRHFVIQNIMATKNAGQQS
jgi:hypothetical protein